MESKQYGIEGYQAPELYDFKWIGKEGKTTDVAHPSDYKGNFIVFYCFQSWCQGCHSHGFPSLQKMTDALKKNDKVKFFAIQTVFEGRSENTFDKLKETQKQYGLKIPFGHDEGDETTQNISSVMYHYRTGGTPWFIFIDQNGVVVFNDYHLNAEKVIEFLQAIS